MELNYTGTWFPWESTTSLATEVINDVFACEVSLRATALGGRRKDRTLLGRDVYADAEIMSKLRGVYKPDPNARVSLRFHSEDLLCCVTKGRVKIIESISKV